MVGRDLLSEDCRGGKATDFSFLNRLIEDITQYLFSYKLNKIKDKMYQEMYHGERNELG